MKNPQIKYIKFLSLSLLLWLIASCNTSQGHSEIDKWGEQAENITIIRDDYGIPHIYGKTDADAVFGLLYAQCEDDFNRVEQNYIWAIGRLAEIEGKESLYSDLRANMFMSKEEAIANYNRSPDWLKKLCEAFADGINYYLHTHPEVKPKLLTRFEPWMPMYFSEGSIGGDIERINTNKIRAFYEDGVAFSKTEEAEIKKREEELEPQGSNGIAISGTLTQSGNAMLLINPHTSFYFRGEVHVISEEGLNAYGAVTWGQFFVYQGFNEKTGWMHTSTYTDVMDEYVEVIEEKEEGLFYVYGEELRPVIKKEVILKYSDNGVMKEKTFPIYRTHHGPITHKENELPVASAMMWEPIKALEQSYIRTKQKDYKGFLNMMDIRTNSSNNTVYADADGNIAYFHGNFVPVRDTIFDFSLPVDGSNPKTDWKGLHAIDENIFVLNPKNGWIQNCNSTPFTAALENSPKRENYPKYMSIDQENFRGIHAIELLRNKSGYTMDSLISLAYDSYLPAFAKLIPGLVSAYDEAKAELPELEGAINILRNWDYRTSEESAAMTLAHFYGTLYGKRGIRPAPMSDMELMSYFGSESPLEERLSIFKEVVSQLESDFGNWNIPWGEVNRFQRLNGDIRQAFDDDKPSIPIGFSSGRWGALAAYGARYNNNTKKIYGTRGNSFVAVVEFGSKVSAKTILAGGQSSNPKSPHFDDQTMPYAKVKFKEAAFYKEDVLKRAKISYKPGVR
ncbi:acylase [Eudoraea sp.]|uniref:acylase n=1 Tax=Eudoraea sp. TaxID=1979955 RepID=UPI003C71257E